MDKKTIIFAALAVVVVMNIAFFALMGHDKKTARQGKRRIPEMATLKTLLDDGGRNTICKTGDAI